MKVEIEEVIANPLAHLEPPFSEADYFELFYRLDLLKKLIEKIRGASLESEEARNADLNAARKSRDTIKR